MLHRLAMLDYFAQHLDDFFILLNETGIRGVKHVHDIVPCKVQVCQTPVFLKDFQQRLHLVWHKLIPADIERD